MVGQLKASTLFSTADKELIKQAISAAELTTSGEIIPVVRSVSGRYDRAEDIIGVLSSLLFFSLAWIFFRDNAGSSAWNSLTFELPGMLLTIALGFIFGVFLSHLFPVLCLPFIPSAEMSEEIDKAAFEAFQQNKLSTTVGSTGILIFISLYEKQVKILGDEAISQKLQQADWQHICDAILESFKQEQYSSGLVAGITLAGELLTQHFPIQKNDSNELANDLILID